MALAPPVRAADLQVNTYTTGGQHSPSVAMDDAGDFVVVWDSFGSSGTDTYVSIQGQRYASSGTPIGGEFQVNTTTLGYQIVPEAAMDDVGDFVVIWSNNLSGAGQLYDSGGTKIGTEFHFGVHTMYSVQSVAVAMDSDGDFVVVWAYSGSYGTDSSGRSVQGQLYDSTGAAIGGQFQVNTYTDLDQRFPAVASEDNGDFVVVWESQGSSGTDTSFTAILGQRYSSTGAAIGSEFQVNSYEKDAQRLPSVAMDSDGDFVVVWESQGSYGTDVDGASIQGQRYSSTGARVGGEFQVNTYTTYGQGIPSVAMDAGGDFIVTWESGNGLFNLDVEGQRYAASGATIGGEFRVNTLTYGYQDLSSVGSDADGNFVVAWSSSTSSGSDSSGASIQAFLSVIFADGFESGGTGSWSSAVP